MTSLPVVPMPDVEAALTALLGNVLDDGVKVGTEWPEDLAAHLAGGIVALSRGGGGTALRFVLDEPTIDFDVFGADKGAAYDLAALVRAHVFAAENTRQGDALIKAVEDVSLIWLPWQAAEGTAPIPRYVLVMSLIVRPVS